MTAVSANDNNPAARWNRGDLEEWRASLSKERRAEDERRLAHLFTLAANVPVFRDALEWANDHGIEFIVDYRATSGGYYTVGTGVVAVAASTARSDYSAVGAMVHEIRHAWQDWYGMIPTTGTGFADYFTRLAVVEADATAHEFQARRQLDLARGIEAQKAARPGPARDKSLASLQGKLRNSETSPDELWRDFTRWYSMRAKAYGSVALGLIGSKLGVPGVEEPDMGNEYRPYKDGEPKVAGIDVTRYDELRRLGKGFKRGNYFNAASRDQFDRHFLAPGRAQEFFRRNDLKTLLRVNDVNDQSQLAGEVRKRALLRKRQAGKAELL